MRAWRLTEHLELDEATAVSLFARLDAHDEQVIPVRQALEQAARELRRMLRDDSGTDAEVDTLMNQIMDAHVEIERSRVELVRGTGDILTARQQASLMLFLPEFDREVRRMIHDFRSERRRGEGRPGEFRERRERRKRRERRERRERRVRGGEREGSGF